MKKFTKILSAMLALLLLVSAMAFVTSCKKEEETENTESNNTVSTDESLSTLDIKDMGGREFAMLWPEYISSEGHFMYNELDVESTSGSVIEEAVYDRNIIVKATYNAKIRVDVMQYSKIASTIKTQYGAGESSYDAIATMLDKMSPLALEGVLTDFNELEYYDESQEWWNHGVMQSLSIVNKRYFGSGDIIYSDDLYPYVVYANTALAEELQITDNFYELVKSKEWTLEKFHELAVIAVADLDADGEEAASMEDRFGAVDGTSFARALYYSAGKGVISLDKQGYPKWEMTTEHAESVLSRIIRMWHTDSAVVDADTQISGKKVTAFEIMDMFNNNQMLFMPGDLKAAQAFTTMDNALEDYALLPIPLWDENSEYICVMNSAVVIGIPTMAKDRDDICLILSAMGRESVTTLTPAFFETVLTYRYMKNPESVETLELILDSVVPRDVADIQGWGGFMKEFSNMVVSGNNTFSSYYGGNISKARSELDKYIDQLDNINK